MSLINPNTFTRQQQAKSGQEAWPDLVDAVLRALPFAMVAVLTISSVLVLTLDGKVDRVGLWGWWALSCLLAGARWAGALLYVREGVRRITFESWYWFLLIGSALSGVLWGAAGWWLWPEEPIYQAFLVVLIGGMVAGAVITLAPIISALLVFIALSVLPLTLRFFTADIDTGLSLGLVTLFFAATMGVTGWRANQLFRVTLEANLGRHRAELDLEREALYDPLTNLPNRRFFLERLQQEFSRAKRHGYTGALLFLDLDNFKTINDSLGHHVGDQLLQEVARRLENRFRGEDVASRLGGDEYVVLLSELTGDPVSCVYEVERIASQVRDLLHEPYLVDEHELFVSSSIGVSLFPQDIDNYQDVLKHADTAMYRAKAQGRNNYQFFLPDMQEEASRRLLVEKDLRAALQSEQLQLHYQPQVDVDGYLVGVEALARWEHPQKHMIPPSDFVTVADDTMLVHDLHAWVVKRACQDIKQLIAHCGVDRAPVVSVNVSARAFHHASFEPELLEQVVHAGIPADKLCLEITETSVMEKVELVIEKMQMLRRSGILFSVDDFGTGYSSLAYLKRLPVDTLKIDRAFVGDVCSDPNDAVIVETILGMAHHLGLKTVAEGVENQETVEFLKSRGCSYFQGWLYGKALPLQEVIQQWCPE